MSSMQATAIGLTGGLALVLWLMMRPRREAQAATRLREIVRTNNAVLISAVESILTQKPSVVLLDIGLPGMNGYEVAQRVHEQEVEPPPQLIAVTGYGLESDKMKAQEVGIAHHLVKPVDPNRLHELLSVLAEKSA